MVNRVEMAPLVSVVIPTHDRLELLARAITSVEAQTHTPIELIVVGSPKTPDVEDIVTSANVEYSLYIDAASTSPGAARNIGIKQANGKFISFLDDDEGWDPSKTELQLKRLKSTGAGVCHTGVRKVGPESKLRAVSRPTEEGNVTRALLTQGPYGEISAMMVRQGLAEQVGGFDERFTLLEDADFNIRLSLHTTFCTIAEPLMTRYIEGHEQATDDVKTRLSDGERLIEKHRQLARQYGPGTEKQMIARLNHTAGTVAADHGMYSQARSQFLTALRYDPTYFPGLLWLGLVAAGPLFFRPAQSTKRTLVRMWDQL